MIVMAEETGVEQGRLLDIEEAATLLNIKSRTIRDYVKHKKIPYIRLGRHLRFEREALNNWIKSQIVQPEPPDTPET